MAQPVEEEALSEERADFIRAMWANELSVEVLHTFLDTAVPKEKDWHDNQYWMSELPKNAKGKLKYAQPFQRDAIETISPQKWDMSVLAFSILNHPNLLKDVQKVAVEKMRDKRNVLSHKTRATYKKEEYDQLFTDLDGSYKSLLGEPEAQDFREKLEKIKEKRIYDKSTEDVLAERDEAVRKAEGREEEIMRIHTELEEDIKKRVKQMKDVTVELKDALTRAQVLTTRLDGHVDGISGSLTTTAPKGSDGARVQADGPDPVPQERDFQKTVKRGDRVVILGLQQFSTPSGRLNILQQVGTDYKPLLGNILLESPNGKKVQTIEATCGQNVDDVVYAIFQKWSSEDGDCTWGKLVHCLRDSNLNALANDIDSCLL